MRWRTSIDLEPHEIAPPIAAPTSASRAGLIATLGLVLVAAAAWSLIALGAIPGAQALPSAGGAVQPVIDATNLPPLLTAADDHLDALRYSIVCSAAVSESDSTCDIDGTVYVRSGASGSFRPLALRPEPGASSGRYTANLPTDIAASAKGFSYYAVIRDRRSGSTVTLPQGGALAPQRSLRLVDPISIDLGVHHFGGTRPATARVASARWGNGPTDVGIEEGPQLEPIGASSFDASSTGTVTVLDEAHKRLLRFTSGAPSTPSVIPVGVRGTIADLAVRQNGDSFVLESVAELGGTPVVQHFDAEGHLAGAWHTAEGTASTIRLGPNGPVALEYPASQWMPIGNDAESSSTRSQTTQGRAGRVFALSRSIVAQREGNEARVALVGATGISKSWRIRSATPLAEIQLAEPLGTKVVVVLRAYTDTDAAFLVLILGDVGLERQFAVDASEWAEAAPLSRFRLAGSSLFHLGSTPTGMFVDRFDLEVQ
jgi:hypothetical protein